MSPFPFLSPFPFPGNDTLNGNEGNDTMSAGVAADGNDVFNGGAGSDTANYSGRTVELYIRLDNLANDGANVSEEYDNVKTDVEGVIAGLSSDNLSTAASAGVNFQGGAGSDTLTGGAGNDVLGGGGDNDTIKGGSGDDEISGGPGNDWLHGDDPAYTSGNGNDVISGDDGNDTCYGGYGDDVITGGLGSDSMFGEAGADDFNAAGDPAPNPPAPPVVDFIHGGFDSDVDEVLNKDDNDTVQNVP